MNERAQGCQGTISSFSKELRVSRGANGVVFRGRCARRDKTASCRRAAGSPALLPGEFAEPPNVLGLADFIIIAASDESRMTHQLQFGRMGQ